MTDNTDNEVISIGDIVLVEVEDGIMKEDDKRYDIGIRDDSNGYWQIFFTDNFFPNVYINRKYKYNKMIKIQDGDISKYFKSLANAYYKLKKEDLDKSYKEFIGNIGNIIPKLEKMKIGM